MPSTRSRPFSLQRHRAPACRRPAHVLVDRARPSLPARRALSRGWACHLVLASVVLVAGLATALPMMLPPPPAAELLTRVGDDWDAGFAALDEGDWRYAFAFGLRVADLPPEEGAELVLRHWSTIEQPAARRNLLKAFHSTVPYPLHARMHPRLLDVLHLGMCDAHEEVREWAESFVGNVAFADLAAGSPEYGEWHERWHAAPLELAYVDGVRRFVERAAQAERDELAAAMELLGDRRHVFRDVAPVREAAGPTGLTELLLDVIAGPDGDAAAEALDILAYLPLEHGVLHEVIIPRIGPGTASALRAQAQLALAASGESGALELLLEQLVHQVTVETIDRSLLWSTARALEELGDLRAVPTMIAAIEAEGTYDTVYGVGWFGLGRLLDVDYDESHDGAWWRAWWVTHRHELGGEVAALEIPALVRDAAADDPSALPADLAHVPVTELSAGGDERKRCFVLGPFGEAPRDGHRLLVVLPGGDGSADFAPFVARLADGPVGDGYVVVQVVAPKWHADQFDRLVWPTAARPWPGAAFPTEELVAAAIAEARARFPIDDRAIYTLSWSSSGPAAYDLSLLEDTPISGSLVMMSVFKPDQLLHPERAAGHPYYIVHSPQDFIPLRMAVDASQRLEEWGATTHLATYAGGHGWNGAAMDEVGRGLRWLEAQTLDGR